MATNGTINGRMGVTKFIVIPMAQPKIGLAGRGYLNEAIVDNEISKGGYIDLFERSWAHMNGYKHGVSCNSGTSALHLALKTVAAHKVLIPNFTMSATAYAAIYEGCEITYYQTRADVPLAEHDINVEGYDTIVFAHIYGRRAYPRGFVKKLKEKNPALLVIDDMAEAHGIRPEGDIACYSFYANKILTTGEGGMCLTNNSLMAEEMRKLANMYFDKGHSMIHEKVGHNYRMTNLQAAIGLGQTEEFEKIMAEREKIERWYNKYLPKSYQNPKRDVLWYYDCKVKNAKKTQYSLEKQGIASRRFFYPMSLQPWGDQMPDDNAMYWYNHGLLLPVFQGMIEQDVRWICEMVVAIQARV